MGRLVIDGNSVYEIDEDCVKHHRVPKECQIYQFLKEEERENGQKEGNSLRGAHNGRRR